MIKYVFVYFMFFLTANRLGTVPIIFLHSKLGVFISERAEPLLGLFLLCFLIVMTRVSCSSRSCFTGAGFWFVACAGAHPFSGATDNWAFLALSALSWVRGFSSLTISQSESKGLCCVSFSSGFQDCGCQGDICCLFRFWGSWGIQKYYFSYFCFVQFHFVPVSPWVGYFVSGPSIGVTLLGVTSIMVLAIFSASGVGALPVPDFSSIIFITSVASFRAWSSCSVDSIKSLNLLGVCLLDFLVHLID